MDTRPPAPFGTVLTAVLTPFDEDGAVDVAAANFTGNSVSIFLNRADTGVDEPERVHARGERLAHSSPNPFRLTTTIRFEVAKPEHVLLTVHDTSGRLVATVVDGHLVAGRFVKTWDGRDDTGGRVASGSYFTRMVAGDFTATRKMVLLR